MEGIEFEEDKSTSGLSIKNSAPAEKPSFLYRLLEKRGVTDKNTANFILLGVVVVFFGVAFFLYAGILGDSNPSKQISDQIEAQTKAIAEMQGLR